MSDARNQFGHYVDGQSLADTQQANVLPVDDQNTVNWKIEQKKSVDLAEYLVKYGSGPARSRTQRKGRWGIFFWVCCRLFRSDITLGVSFPIPSKTMLCSALIYIARCQRVFCGKFLF